MRGARAISGYSGFPMETDATSNAGKVLKEFQGLTSLWGGCGVNQGIMTAVQRLLVVQQQRAALRGEVDAPPPWRKFPSMSTRPLSMVKTKGLQGIKSHQH